MQVTTWGTRGTFPVPGPATVRYGGDTTCLSVEFEDRVLVVDTGTGIRALGAALENDGRDVVVLFTHIHADHVMGFPFFKPLYEKGRTVSVIDHQLGECEWSATALLDGVHFPLTPAQVPCDLRRISKDPLEFLDDFGLKVRRILLNHPGGAYGYRFEGPEKSFVFIPDNEIFARKEPTLSFDRLVEFCAGADVLVHDAQFRESEYESFCGWGHSTPKQACELAIAAEVGLFMPTHHDPYRTDDQLDEVLADAREWLSGTNCQVQIAADQTTVPI